MPSDTNSTGTFEVTQSPNVDAAFQRNLNERMRRIGQAFQNLGTTSGSSSSSSSSSSASLGQVVLIVRGILAVESTAAPLITLPAAKSFSKMTLILGTLPIGGPVVVQLFANGATWGPALTATGQVTTADVSSYPAIAQDALVRLDITSVPALLSGVSYPGADLTVELR